MINYVVGDALSPDVDGSKIIVHICNDIGAWGAGFVVALSHKWKMPEKVYRKAFDKSVGMALYLGDVQFIKVADDVMVVNMVAQHGIGKDEDGVAPIRYDALKECLDKVFTWAIANGASVHMPRIGCGLAGGKWEEVEKVLVELLGYIAGELDVYVYDLK